MSRSEIGYRKCYRKKGMCLIIFAIPGMRSVQNNK